MINIESPTTPNSFKHSQQKISRQLAALAKLLKTEIMPTCAVAVRSIRMRSKK